jgi:hypothetical protein
MKNVFAWVIGRLKQEKTVEAGEDYRSRRRLSKQEKTVEVGEDCRSRRRLSKQEKTIEVGEDYRSRRRLSKQEKTVEAGEDYRSRRRLLKQGTTANGRDGYVGGSAGECNCVCDGQDVFCRCCCCYCCCCSLEADRGGTVCRQDLPRQRWQVSELTPYTKCPRVTLAAPRLQSAPGAPSRPSDHPKCGRDHRLPLQRPAPGHSNRWGRSKTNLGTHQ